MSYLAGQSIATHLFPDEYPTKQEGQWLPRGELERSQNRFIRNPMPKWKSSDRSRYPPRRATRHPKTFQIFLQYVLVRPNHTPTSILTLEISLTVTQNTTCKILTNCCSIINVHKEKTGKKVNLHLWADECRGSLKKMKKKHDQAMKDYWNSREYGQDTSPRCLLKDENAQEFLSDYRKVMEFPSKWLQYP